MYYQPSLLHCVDEVGGVWYGDVYVFGEYVYVDGFFVV